MQNQRNSFSREFSLPFNVETLQAFGALFLIPHYRKFVYCKTKILCTVGRQIKLGHLKFNLCKSDHSIVNIFVSVYIICHTKVNLFVTKP
jgi:hypothetical protein